MGEVAGPIGQQAPSPDTTPMTLTAAGRRYQAGEFRQAEAQCKEVLRAEPRNADALHLLGVVMTQMGDKEAAVDVISRAVALNPNLAEAHCNLGILLRDLGRVDAAITSCRTAIKLDPGYADAYSNLGVALRDCGKLDEAIESLRKAIALKPNFAEAYRNFAVALYDQGKLDKAIALCRKAILLAPDHAGAHSNLGNMLRDRGRLEQAAAEHLRALVFSPNSAEALNNLGIVFKTQGRLEKARACFRRAIEIEPDYVEACFNHATVYRFRPGDREIKRLESLFRRPRISEEQRNRLRFSLGKAHDDIGNHTEAFLHYEAANEEVARRVKFESDGNRCVIAEIKRAFPRERVSTASTVNDTERIAVFVVGMSRSGKTMVESLLSRHENAYGAGESQEWDDAVGAVLKKHSVSEPFPRCIGLMSVQNVKEIGLKYLEFISNINNKARLFINTTPSNYKFIGLILEALQNAKIIYCQRDMMDNCTSVYFRFYTHGHYYSYTLSDIASYSCAYQDMMAHWRLLYGDRLLTVLYEDLARDAATVGARIYDFCGLDCDPEAFSGAFTTDEIGRSAPYTPYLEELRNALGGLTRQPRVARGSC